MAEQHTQTNKTAKAGKGKMVIVLASVGVLALGGGGFAAYRYMGRGGAHAETAAKDSHEAAPEKTGSGIVSFDPFVANLADAGGGRFARISVKLVVANQAEAKELQENAVVVARLRSEILDLLMAQRAERLVTPEGKAELKKTIAERAAGIATPVKVTDVLFSDFVIQF